MTRMQGAGTVARRVVWSGTMSSASSCPTVKHETWLTTHLAWEEFYALWSRHDQMFLITMVARGSGQGYRRLHVGL